MGAAGGSLFGGSAQALGIDLNLSNFMILGMAGFFAAVVRAPVTGILLICEMTGTLSHMLSLTLVSLVAYIAADLLGVPPIYDQLLKRILRNLKPRKGESDTGKKILIDTPVHMGAAVCGRRISQINWPTGCLLVSVQRGEREFVPHWGTKKDFSCDKRKVLFWVLYILPATNLIVTAPAIFCFTAGRTGGSPA